MYLSVFVATGIAQSVLFLWTFLLWRDTRIAALGITLPPVFFFAWDDFRIAVSPFIGLGDTLYWLTWPGYWAHWLLGSWLLIASVSVLRLAGLDIFQARWVMGGCCLVAVGLTLHDLPQFWTRDLHPVCDLEIMRYGISVNEGNRCFASQPLVPGNIPITPVMACLIALGSGIVLWARRKIPWLAIGSIVMLITALPAFSRHGLEYLGEALIEAGLVASIWVMIRKPKDQLA